MVTADKGLPLWKKAHCKLFGWILNKSDSVDLDPFKPGTNRKGTESAKGDNDVDDNGDDGDDNGDDEGYDEAALETGPT